MHRPTMVVEGSGGGGSGDVEAPIAFVCGGGQAGSARGAVRALSEKSQNVAGSTYSRQLLRVYSVEIHWEADL